MFLNFSFNKWKIRKPVISHCPLSSSFSWLNGEDVELTHWWPLDGKEFTSCQSETPVIK